MSVDLVVIGLGHVGLRLVQAATRAGLQVRGLDLSRRVVDGLNAGRSHVDDLSDGDVAKLVAAGFTATTDPDVLGEAETVVICVPTPLSADGGPDLGAVESDAPAVAEHLRAGMLVVLESTMYPGTVDEVVRPLLEKHGLSAGTDFNLAISPERIDPGNPVYGMTNTPKVVGGCTPECTERASAFYARFVDTVVRAPGTRDAEMVESRENTYRHVNIALVTEMVKFWSEMCVDLWDVIHAASTKPFGSKPFHPGPGVGGHCVPIDPNYSSYKVRTLGYPFRFVELAQEINASMPTYMARRIQNLLNQDGKAVNGARVPRLDVTYKPDIADQRELPATPLAVQLQAMGAEVSFRDPHVETWRLGGQGPARVPDLASAVAEADLTVLLQNHPGCDNDQDIMVGSARRLFDTGGQLQGATIERL